MSPQALEDSCNEFGQRLAIYPTVPEPEDLPMAPVWYRPRKLPAPVIKLCHMDSIRNWRVARSIPLKSNETSSTPNLNTRQLSSGFLETHVPRRWVWEDLRQKGDKRLDVWIAAPAFRPVGTDMAAVDGELFQDRHQRAVFQKGSCNVHWRHPDATSGGNHRCDSIAVVQDGYSIRNDLKNLVADLEGPTQGLTATLIAEVSLPRFEGSRCRISIVRP